MKTFQSITLCAAAAAAVAICSSCAATKGLGQDLQKVGNRLEDKADETGGARPDPGTTRVYTRPATGIYSPSAPANTPYPPPY